MPPMDGAFSKAEGGLGIRRENMSRLAGKDVTSGSVGICEIRTEGSTLISIPIPTPIGTTQAVKEGQELV